MAGDNKTILDAIGKNHADVMGRIDGVVEAGKRVENDLLTVKGDLLAARVETHTMRMGMRTAVKRHDA